MRSIEQLKVDAERIGQDPPIIQNVFSKIYGRSSYAEYSACNERRVKLGS